ncbi:MAG: hypothetical protein JJU11_01425 [Candidatus Sumerlaeia bacterium]|nr:hypothetical protein [Candidatus Sumerlaeia bacterium]
MSDTIEVPKLDDLLAASKATDEFKEAVRVFESDQSPSDRVIFKSGNPPVKVLRVIMGLLETAVDYEIETVEVNGVSGCSDYRGTVTVNDGDRVYHFAWDCAWKAKEMGWTDFMGYPDQIKAARTFGYQCFEQFKQMN